ncbi:MAG TPA: hypothetical protein ENI72_01920 [Rhodospirillales bacterium]|nr:hypothetical protein [Rhodospirillales bacterium]
MVEPAPPHKLSIVVFSGDFERVHYALVMASAAAAIGRKATLFFTMEASRALLKPGPSGAGGGKDRAYIESGVAGFEELLVSCAALGVRFMVCEMGLRALNIKRRELRDDLGIEEGGVVTFLNDASATGSMVFI